MARSHIHRSKRQSFIICIIFSQVVDKHIPLIERCVKSEKQPGLVTDEIRKTIKLRDNCRHKNNKKINLILINSGEIAQLSY